MTGIMEKSIYSLDLHLFVWIVQTGSNFWHNFYHEWHSADTSFQCYVACVHVLLCVFFFKSVIGRDNEPHKFTLLLLIMSRLYSSWQYWSYTFTQAVAIKTKNKTGFSCNAVYTFSWELIMDEKDLIRFSDRCFMQSVICKHFRKILWPNDMSCCDLDLEIVILSLHNLILSLTKTVIRIFYIYKIPKFIWNQHVLQGKTVSKKP